MAKINREKIREQTRNRNRLYRGVNAIMKENITNLSNTFDLRKKLISRNDSKVSNDENSKPSTLSSNLRSWALDYNVNRRAVSALLKILVTFGFHSLPKDSRTLLKTPKTVEIKTCAGGQYWHNGLSNCLTKIFAKLKSNIKIRLNINMDGLPLYKSSSISFWPILANIHGTCVFLP